MVLPKFRGGLLSNGSLNSLIDKEIEEAVEEKKREKVNLNCSGLMFFFHKPVFFFFLIFVFYFEKSSSSESEGEDDSGIFTKIKEKAADVFD